MTKPQQTSKKPHAKKKNVFLQLAPLVIILATGIFTTVMQVPRESLPAFVRDLKPTIAAYEWRDKKFPPEEKNAEAVVDKTTGYPKQDRSKIEKLISEGAHDD